MAPESARRRHGRPPHLRQRLSRRHRRWFYFFGFLLFASGAGWLISHYALRSEELVAEGAPHPAEPWWLRVHGAALLGFLLACGALLPGHVWSGWRHGVNRRSGLAMIGIVAVLTVTGYALYYATSDAWREYAVNVHWIVGLASLAALVWHVVRGRSLRVARQRSAAPH